MSNQVLSSQNISQIISSLFDSAGDNIEPINIPNNILPNKEITSLIKNFKDSNDWDGQLSVIQHAIAIIKGNGCNYLDFVSQLPDLITEMRVCIQSTRTTLVKYYCLLISLLAKTLKERFDNITDIVFTPLFQVSSSGTQIASSSCKCAIFSIVHNVQTRKVLSSILSQVPSGSPSERQIASESLKYIVNEWNRNSLFPFLKQLEKSIYDLLSDSNKIIKNDANAAGTQLIKLFPDRNSVLFSICNNRDDNEKNGSKGNGFSKKKDFSFSQDYSNTISFSCNFPQIQPKNKQETENKVGNTQIPKSTINSSSNNFTPKNTDYKFNGNSTDKFATNITEYKFNGNSTDKFNADSKSTINNSDSNDRNYISNILRKKPSTYLSSEYRLPDNNFNEANTMTFSFETSSLSSQSSLSSIQKQVDEAQTISIDLFPSKTTSLYTKERSKINSNLSVHFQHSNKNKSISSELNDKDQDNSLSIDPTRLYYSNYKQTDSILPNKEIDENKENNSIFQNQNKEDQNSGTHIELSTPSYFSTSLISVQPRNFECNQEKETQEKFLESVRTSIATKQTIYILDNADSISRGFLTSIQSPDEIIQVSALNLLVDVITLIPNSFETNLELLIKIILEKADKNNTKTSMNAIAALWAISGQYPSEELALLSSKFPETDSLLSFLANLVRNDESILNNDQIASTLLPICCKVYETTKEQRFSALSVGLLNKISEKNPKIFKIFANSVDEKWVKLLKSLYLDPKGNFNDNNDKGSITGPNRILSSLLKYTKKDNSPESRLDDLLRQLNVEKIKFTAFNNLINFFNETNGEVFESAIPQLVDLIHSGYNDQVKECIKVIAQGGMTSSFLSNVVDYYVNDPSLKSTDFLRDVVKYYKSRDLSPRVQQILEKARPFLEDSSASARKAGVLLIVELRLSIGKVFDGEINKLSNVSKKMVLYYLSKRQNNC